MKLKNILLAILFFVGIIFSQKLISQNDAHASKIIQGPTQRTCGTGIPSQQWESLFQQQIAAFLAANPDITNGKLGGNNNQAVYTIPVIIHVIHGGQAVGTFPNLAQGQCNSQIQVLNDDFAGVGQNVGNYPASAFTTWATNTIVSAASKDGFGRIKIANTGITFCLALKDTLGNTLVEPGIHRVDYNTIAAPLGPFPSKNPANAAYNTIASFQNFINGYIKPNTIWNVTKYMNLWVTDEQASVGLLGYATFPPLSGLVGIPGGIGTATTDGFWAWSAAFGSKTIFPGGTYTAGYDLGRTCTHEIGHWVGLRHIWGDGFCATDYCNDTPPASAANFNNCPVAYPLKSGSCAGPPSNAPNGEMFMNFMDYTYDCAMYMFTEDQRTRIQTAMLNSPYRKLLGTHGLCSVPPPVANFSINPNPVCAGQTATITDMSTGSPGAWSYTMTGGAPATSTLQSPTVVYAAAGVYTITLIAINGGGPSLPISKTITVNAIPVLTVTASPTLTCVGANATITSSGATTYTCINTGGTGPSIVVTPTAAITIYTITGANGTCASSKTVSIVASPSPTVNAVANPTVICSGGSSTLTASGAITYTWNTGATTTVIVVSPTVTTTYTVTGSNAGGCTNSKTVSVVVNANPTVNIVATPTAICSGSSATLTASGATTYTWNTGATTAAIVVSPTITANYTVTGANGACTGTKTISVIVNAAPVLTVIATPTSICSGSSATITSSGATTYTLNTGATGANIVVSPTITTTYTVTGDNGSCTSTKTIAVVVIGAPSLTITPASATICVGSSVTFTGSGATTYTWSTGPTTATAIVSPTVTTTYTLTGSNGGACISTKTVAVTVNSNPTVNIVATPTAICAGSSSTLTASGAATYTWNTGALTAAIVVSPTITTNYTVTGANGACTGTKTISLIVNSSPTINISPASATVCAGSSVTFTGSGALTYTWNTGATTANLTVTPIATTPYTLTGTNAAGCTASKTTTVTVNPLPTVTITANPISICPGSSSTLTAVASGPGPWTYTWSTGATTNVITTTVATVYSATVTNANGCKGSVSYTLGTSPSLSLTAISNPAALCNGNTATITVSGATSYTWNTGAITSTIVVTPTITTTYSVVGTSGACSGTTTVILTVNANPTVTATSSPTSICAGASSTLSAIGAITYTWNTGATTANITVSPIINTTYTVTGSNAAGCTNSKTISVIVNPNPTVSAVTNNSLLCTGQTATLTGSGATTYTWNTGATTAVIAVSPTITTTYTLTGTTAGCSNLTTVTQSVSTCAGVQALGVQSSEFGVYPNPNNGEFIISVNKITDNTFVEVYNGLGQLVNRNALKDLTNKVNLTKEADGIYHVRIIQDGKSVYGAKVLKN